MSRIRLEWQVETRKTDLFDSEDPGQKRARRRRMLRLILFICAVFALVIMAFFAFRQRLLDVQAQLERLLRETVQAEAAALRIGDVNSFIAAQDGANEAWLRRQRAVFNEYSDIKAAYDVDLSGAILELEIDGERGRALVEERINGARFAQVWFYRKLEQGWRHVAPDFTFWGEPQQLDSDALSIRYFALDQRFAQALSDTLNEWLRQACADAPCESISPLSIQIVNQAPAPAEWSPDGSATLQVLSPLTGRMSPFSPLIGRMSIEAPFDSNLQEIVAAVLAQP